MYNRFFHVFNLHVCNFSLKSTFLFSVALKWRKLYIIKKTSLCGGVPLTQQAWNAAIVGLPVHCSRSSVGKCWMRSAAGLINDTAVGQSPGDMLVLYAGNQVTSEASQRKDTYDKPS